MDTLTHYNGLLRKAEKTPQTDNTYLVTLLRGPAQPNKCFGQLPGHINFGTIPIKIKVGNTIIDIGANPGSMPSKEFKPREIEGYLIFKLRNERKEKEKEGFLNNFRKLLLGG
ncbi:MAG: hypothetical protein QXW10_03450 [Candidatus Micrarchaeaceae archaeon]